MKKILLVTLCLMFIFVGSVSADSKSFADLVGASVEEIVRIDIRSGSTGLTVISVEAEDIIREIYDAFDKGNYTPVEKTPGSSAGGWLYQVNFRTDELGEPAFSYTLFTGSSPVDGVEYQADNAIDIRDTIKKYVDNPFDYEGVLVGSGTPSAEAVTPSDWAGGEVESAEKAGIIPDGFTNKYRDPITRGQFCDIAYKVLVGKDSLNAVSEEKQFEDTDSQVVAKLYSAGIIAGRSDTEFAPYEYITREEAAVILSKMIDALNLPADEGEDVAFADDEDISDWAKNAVYKCLDYEVMMGTDAGFEPKGTYTVEQAIATMIRLYDRAPEEYDFADKLNMEMPEDENYMFSPYSVKLALAMAANGAEGETQSEILNVLGISDIDEFNNQVKEQMVEFASYTERGLVVEPANSIWINTEKTSQSFSEDFRNIISEYYGGTADKVAGEVEPINNWVSEKTHGLIEKIVEEPEFVSILVNALYFKGRWESEFNSELTENREFIGRDGSKKEISFMNGVEKFEYASLGGVEAVKLPYAPYGVEMCIIKGGSDHINPVKFLEKAEFKLCDVTLSIPRFRTEYSCSLMETLKKLGINEAFLSGAKFGPMFDKDSGVLSDVIHKTYIDVNEEGTEAAAITAIMTFGGAWSSEYDKIEFVADEPFTYVIYDETHGEILFIGEYAYAC